MIALVARAGGIRQFDRESKQRGGFVRVHADRRKAFVARLVAGRNRAARAGGVIVVMQLLDRRGRRSQHAGRPQGTRDVLAAPLELGREAAIEDDRFVVPPHFRIQGRVQVRFFSPASALLHLARPP